MPTVRARTVRRAAEIVGGVQLLAEALHARDDTLRKWLEGELAVPEDVFLRCADIVNAHQLDEISRPTYSPPKDPA